MSDTPARSDAGTTPTSGALLVALAPLLSMVEDRAAEIAPAVVADAARRARLTIGALITERDDATAERERLETERETSRQLVRRLSAKADRLEAEARRLREYYEANEALEAESDEDVEAVHRALLRFVSARRALTSTGEEPAAQEAFACGCVTCICEDRVRCHGCGARLCGKPDDECDWLNERSVGEEPSDG
jgi:hypothetical protein